LKEFRL